jgi:hypothetical protein
LEKLKELPALIDDLKLASKAFTQSARVNVSDTAMLEVLEEPEILFENDSLLFGLPKLTDEKWIFFE